VPHRSFSQLSSYAQCSEQYRLERLYKTPDTPAAWTALGSAFHRTYEIWEHAGRSSDLAVDFTYYYDKEIQELIGKQPDFSYWDKTPNVKSVEQDIKLRREHGIKQTLAYAEHALKSPWKIHKYPELGGSITLGDIVVRWTADVVLEWPDGQLTVRDIKTGNKGNVKSNLQLGIYKLGLQENFGIEVTQGEFWFTKDGTSGGYDNLQRYTRSYIEDLFVSLERGIAGKVFLPNPGSHCKFCGVKPFCRELGVIGNVPTSR